MGLGGWALRIFNFAVSALILITSSSCGAVDSKCTYDVEVQPNSSEFYYRIKLASNFRDGSGNVFKVARDTGVVTSRYVVRYEKSDFDDFCNDQVNIIRKNRGKNITVFLDGPEVMGVISRGNEVLKIKYTDPKYDAYIFDLYSSMSSFLSNHGFKLEEARK